MNIEIVENGWIVSHDNGTKKVFDDLQDLFDYLLLSLEGKSDNFGGSLYGKVILKRTE